MMITTEQNFTLRRNGDQILIRFDGESDETPVRIVLLRPLSAPDGEVSILHADKKKELAMITNRQMLEQPMRDLIDSEIDKRYFLPDILKIHSIDINLGYYYWDVETDRGNKKFLLTNPGTNIHRLNEKHCLLNDSFGNHYEIRNIHELDADSRNILGRLL